MKRRPAISDVECPAMTSAETSRSRAVRPYAAKSKADQLVTACRLDADRNLIFVAADERAGLQNGPLTAGISQSGSEGVRAGGASAYSHNLHHHHEPAGCDLIKPVPPFLTGRGQSAKLAARSNDNDCGVASRR